MGFRSALTGPARRFANVGRRRALQPILRRQRAILQTNQVQLTLEYRALAAGRGALPTYRDVGFGVFCDSDEDGILLFLTTLVGSGSRRLIDLGFATVEASNSANLVVHHGWTGLLVDADGSAIGRAQAEFRALGAYPPRMVSAWLTAESVDDLLGEHAPDGEIDVLSIDIDGNDYWVWQAIEVVRPRIVVIEYQDIIGPGPSITIPYDPEFSLDRFPVNAEHNNYVGASLRAMTTLAARKGYHLVATNSLGFNAFFLRDDLATPLIPEIAVEDGFPHPWNDYGIRERWPLVADMPWQEV